MAAIVYLATNRINGKRYVGVTSHGLPRRRREHENAPNAKRVTCRYFHAAIRKHGKEAFDWIELRSCATFDEALREEIRLISEIRPEYNLTPGGQGNASKRGPLSPEKLAARREKMANYVVSAETREKLRQYHLGRKRNPEVGRKISAKRMGMKFTAKHIDRLRIARTGKKATPEAIEKRAAGRRGKPLSIEHRENIRQTLRGRKRPPEVVAKMLASRATRYAAKPWLELGIAYSTWTHRQKKLREASHGLV